jgi:putative transposase
MYKGIVGWSTADNMKTSLCVNALKNAVKRYRPAPGLIHHSDRGIQYCNRNIRNS